MGAKPPAGRWNTGCRSCARIRRIAPLVREEIWRCLTRLRGAGQSILLIDKNVEALTRLADRHYILEKGRVAWEGSSAALRSDTALWHRYLGV